MADAPSFTKLVPGFDFLQGLVKNAGAALPNMGQWIAPTLNPQELERRIEELRTVQFWLEQNARMLGATIQALEVQRMTLSTLQTMNVQMDDLRESMKIRVPTAQPAAEAKPAPAAVAAPAKKAAAKRGKGAAAAKNAAPTTAAGPVDPMQWWGALTQQFTQLATAAMKDGASGAAKTMAEAFAPAAKSAATPPATKAAAPRAPAGKKAAPRKRAAQRP